MLPSSDHFDLCDLMTRDGFHDISQTEQKYNICTSMYKYNVLKNEWEQ